MAKRIDLTNMRFGKLVVLEYAGVKSTQTLWKCKCDCGNITYKYGNNLRRGASVSCGCDTKQKFVDHAHRTIAKEKHGDSFFRLYFVWNDIKSRCYNPNDISYANYGGKGISVCDEWRNDYTAFKDWAMANGYNPFAKRGECTLDRIDNQKGYCPENCRWVDMRTQSNNRRNSYTITHDGKTLSASQWSEITGIPEGVIYYRYKAGWPVGKLLSKAKYGPNGKARGSY